MISDVEHVAFADAGRGFISFSARGGPWFRQHQSRNVTEAGFCQVPVVLLPAGLHVLCFWKPSSNHWLKGIRMDSLFCLGRNMCDEISSGLQTLLATPSNPCSPAAGEDPRRRPGRVFRKTHGQPDRPMGQGGCSALAASIPLQVRKCTSE